MDVGTNVFHYIDTDRFKAALKRGVDFNSSIYVYEKCSTNPNNLTGFSPLLVVKNSQNLEILSCSFNNGRASIDLDQARITFAIPAHDTAVLPLGFYDYEILITSLDNISYRLAYGRFEIARHSEGVGCH